VLVFLLKSMFCQGVPAYALIATVQNAVLLAYRQDEAHEFYACCERTGCMRECESRVYCVTS
jgi:hypothetical protein